MPLRPLALGDVFGGALTLIRRNPRATVGVAALVNVAFLVVPVLVSLAIALAGSASPVVADGTGTGFVVGADVSLSIGTVGSGLFAWLASIVVTGLVVPVVEHGLVGIKLGAGEAWRRSRGRLLPLLGLSVLTLVVTTVVVGVPVGLGILLGVLVGGILATVLLAVLGGLLGLVAVVFLFTRFALLAPPALVSEGLGVAASIRRAAGLTTGSSWRLFGIYLLASLAASLIGQVFAIPLGILSGVGAVLLPDRLGAVVLLLGTNISTVLSGAIVTPFTGAVVTLLYFDQRFRKEGLDINLLNDVQSGRRR